MKNSLHLACRIWVQGPKHALLPAALTSGCVLARYLVEVYGFQHTFLLTAVLKAAGWFPLVPALFYVTDGVCTCATVRPGKHRRPDKQPDNQNERAGSSQNPGQRQQGAPSGNDSLQQPLLQNGHHESIR